MRKQNIVNRPFALDAGEDYRIKATLGITGWLRLRVHIDGAVRHLDVGSTYPGGGEAPKGMAVRHLKSYASWVQTVQKKDLRFRMYDFRTRDLSLFLLRDSIFLNHLLRFS